MAMQESYMLGRDQEETKRLDTQHLFMRQLTHGSLLHHSINPSNLRAVADVGTGTGIWLREAARELRAAENPIEFTGFDISPQQFPTDKIQNVEFVVHDVVEPFQPQYHAKFDVVHVRFLSFALKAQDLNISVENIVRIIREYSLRLMKALENATKLRLSNATGPGGYLQWLEVDVVDCWAIPDTPNARSTIYHVVSERLARGLTPA